MKIKIKPKIKQLPYSLRKGNCLELMKDISDGSVDMILCDLPYGTTACKWDTIITFEPLWEQYKRVIKPNGAICLFGSEPFSSYLRLSNIKQFKYDWIWKKSQAGGAFNAKHQPLKTHEIVSVFCYSKMPTQKQLIGMVYYPQGIVQIEPKVMRNIRSFRSNFGGNRVGLKETYKQTQTNYPKTVIEFNNDKGLHPTQKPVALMEYLIKTYTNEGELVLDNCMGSGTTGIACLNTNRRFIGMELDPEYFRLAKERIEKHNA